MNHCLLCTSRASFYQKMWSFFFSGKQKKSGLICNREPFWHHFQKSSGNTEFNKTISSTDTVFQSSFVVVFDLTFSKYEIQLVISYRKPITSLLMATIRKDAPEKIDQYMAKLPDFSREICTRLREWIHKAEAASSQENG